MSYKLNKTNGDLLVELVDGRIDTTTTNLTLVGKNFSGFGEYFNENFIKLLENFAGSSAPGAPLVGQTWYDSAAQRLKIYNGETFANTGAAIVADQQPAMIAGDMWLNSETEQVYVQTATGTKIIGPMYTKDQGKTTFETISVVDEDGNSKTLIKLVMGNVLKGVFADSEFTVPGNSTVAGFPTDPTDLSDSPGQIFKQGFNTVDEEFWWHGNAASASAIIDETGTAFSLDKFMRTDIDTSAAGKIDVRSSEGVTFGIGSNKYGAVKVNTSTHAFEIESLENNGTLNVLYKNGTTKSAIYLDGSNERIGIFNSSPAVELDVDGSGKFTGDVTVNGSLTVLGEASYFNVNKLTVEDKNIELGLLNDSTEGNDITVDGAGIIVRSVDGSKDWIWSNITKSWTSNQNIDLLATPTVTSPAIKINSIPVLGETYLGSTITDALGLARIGTLENLNVDEISIDGTAISSTNTLTFNSTGSIIVNNNTITGLAEPVSLTDAATKNYVDTEIASETIGFSLDISGLSDPFIPGVGNGPVNDVRAILESLYPAATKTGAIARIHCTSYTATSVTVPQASLIAGTVKTYEDVDQDNVSRAVSVLEDLTYDPAGVTGTATLSPDRYTMEFTSNGTVWTHNPPTSVYP